MSAVSKVIFGNQTLIDLTSDTIASDGSDLLYGVTAHGADGEVVTGACTYDADTSDANATASEILTGKSGYVNGTKVNGSMPNRGAVSGSISSLSTPYSVQNGYHDGSGTVGIDSTEAAKIIDTNIKSGVTILGVTGSYAGEPVTATSISVTPYTTAKTYLPPSGYDYISQATVAAIAKSEVTDPVHGGTIVTIGTVDPDA